MSVPTPVPRGKATVVARGATKRLRHSQKAEYLSPSEPAQPLLYYRFNTTNRRSQMLPAVIHTTQNTPRVQRRRMSCLICSLVLLIVLALGLVMSWFFVVQPFIQQRVQEKLETSLTQAEENVHPPPFFMSGVTVPIQEQTITDLLTSNVPSSYPISKENVRITPNGIKLDFQAEGLPSTISAVPYVEQEHLAVRDVHIDGIASLAISPDELTDLLNKHLASAQNRFQHPLTNVQLKDGEMDVTF
jgi:hypothetical protein